MLQKLGLTFALGASLLLGGCETFQKFQNAVSVAVTTEVTVPSNKIIAAANAFNGVQIIAEKYISLPRCGANSTFACRDPYATAEIITNIRKGRIVRDELVDFVERNCPKEGPCNLPLAGKYDALQTAITTVQRVLTSKGIQS